MLTKKWAALVKTSALCDFFDTLLRGYGQILFCNNPLIGLIFLVGFLDSPLSGIIGLIGGISAIITAILMRIEHSVIKSGLFGTNGGLIGFAFSVYLSFNLPLLILATILAGIVSTILTKFLINTMSVKLELPVLSIPFVIITWLSLLSLRLIPNMSMMTVNLNKFLTEGQIEQLILPLLPGWLSLIFHTMSAIFFQHSALIGILCLAGLITYSRISAIFGLAGGILGIVLFGIFATTSGDYTKQLTVSFNCALIGIALGGFLVVLTWQSMLYALFAVFIGAVAGLGLFNLLGIFHMPALAIPFNLITLLFLYILMVASAKSHKAGLDRISLGQATKPEVNINWHLAANVRRVKQIVKFSLPFYGTWYISCGNNSQRTHRGASAYAWDFIVLDEHRKTYRGSGASNEDYYSFGLPVLAPAPGNVVRVVNSIPDNTPSMANWEQSWGNFVIIGHGNNEFSEISHFRQHSIVVREGDKVERGQLLAQCGNSGLSFAPHIHYQLQSARTIGANSIPAKFHNYVTHKGAANILIKEGVLKERESVSN